MIVHTCFNNMSEHGYKSSILKSEYVNILVEMKKKDEMVCDRDGVV